MACRKDNVTVRWGSREAAADRKVGLFVRSTPPVRYREGELPLGPATRSTRNQSSLFLPSSGARERSATLEKFLGWQKQADLANRPQATCLPHKPAYTIFHPNRTVQAEQRRLTAAKRLALIAFRSPTA